MRNSNKKALTFALVMILIPLLAWQWPNIFRLINLRLQNKPLGNAIACPIKDTYLCSIATTLEVSSGPKKESFGLGWRLPEKTEILAAFDGTVKIQSTFGGLHPPKIYLLTNSANTFQAGYLFVPERPFTQAEEEAFAQGKQVKKGEVLATVPGTTLDEMGYKNLNFQFYIVDLKKKERINTLTPKSFGSLVLP